MSRIRGKNTKPEILVRKGLHARGFRFRLHNKKLPGSPDIVLPKYGVAIMVNGCFWHGHKGCRYATRPKSNVEFWETKIAQNRHRDEVTIAHLESLGWHVIVVWECEIRHTSFYAERMDRLANEIRQISDAKHDYDVTRRLRNSSAKIEKARSLKRLLEAEKEINALYKIPKKIRAVSKQFPGIGDEL
jgi:DNA mismatch endonuclease (patch repair protein)